MNRAERENVARHLADHHGLRAVVEEEWTRQLALDALRENRRRYASNPRVPLISGWGAGLAEDAAKATGVDPADIATVLLYASSWVGGLALIHRLPSHMVTNVLGYAADDLDRKARAEAGERP